MRKILALVLFSVASAQVLLISGCATSTDSASYFTMDRLANVLDAVGKMGAAYGAGQVPQALPPGASYYPRQQSLTCQTYGNRTNCQQY